MDLKKICIDIAVKYNLYSIGLFGSRSRGDFDETSDYDIFIIGDINLDNELLLEYELEKLLDNDVDVIKITDTTDKIFLKNLLNEAVVFYNKDNKFEEVYKSTENFFIENNDFIYYRERDLIG